MKRKFAAVLAILLALLMVLAVIAPYIVRGETVGASQAPENTAAPLSMPASVLGDDASDEKRDFQAEIKALEAEIKKLKNERTTLYNNYAKLVAQSQAKEKEINALLDEMASIGRQIEKLETEITKQEGIIEGLNQEIRMKEREIADQEEKLAKAEANAKEYSDYLSYRLKMMYEQPEQSTLELLLSSKTLADFFCRVENMQQVYEYDKRCVAELRAIRDEIAELIRAIEAAKAALETERASYEEECRKLEAQKSEQTKLLDRKSAREAELEAELSVLVSKSNTQASGVDAKDAEIKALEKKLAKVKEEYEEFRRKQEEKVIAQAVASHPKLAGMRFFWPLWVERYTYVGEGWGYHYHPITGKYTKHYGIDIPAPRGTAIHACEAGTVVAAYTSGWNSGYGNLIIIQHQNGVQTWYGHCDTVKVRVGQTVERGDIIGLVGTTGNSTGYHLHLELIISGTDVDPEKYIGKVFPK